jgi:hypothetical protein
MLINEILRILAQVRFLGYPLFLPKIRPFFCGGIEFEAAADRGRLLWWTCPQGI